MSGFWDGNATDWGTAAGTVGLALVTTWVAIREGVERRELRAERDEERAKNEVLESDKLARAEQDAREAEEQERRTYAKAVSCYMDAVAYTPDTVTIMPGTSQTPQEGTPVECAVIRNLSDAPIRTVEVFWQNAQGPDGPVGDVHIGSAGLLSVVPPASLRAIRRPDELGGPDWTRSMLAVLVKFTDINGLRWARRDDGRLYRITDGGVLGEQV